MPPTRPVPPATTALRGAGRSPGVAALPPAIAKPFADVQSADAQLVDLDDPQAGPLDRQAPDHQAADGERADRDGSDCQGADGERADGLGLGRLGARLGADPRRWRSPVCESVAVVRRRAWSSGSCTPDGQGCPLRLPDGRFADAQMDASVRP